MNTSDDQSGRRRRRQHRAEFKAEVVAACRKPGVSIAAVALANGLNANLLRRLVATEEQGTKPIDAVIASPARSTVENRAFIPIQVARPAVNTMPMQEITIELRRGAMVVKVGWPLVAAGDCAAWLRELLR